MKNIFRSGAVLGAALLVAGPQGSGAQGLADRIASASTPRVQFTYAGRKDVCGNGRSFFSIANNSWHGSWSDDDRRESCIEGPVRVVLDRAGREIVSISTFVGPVPEPQAGITDLGRVRARDAADYLLGLAERGEGRVSRDALTPAIIADSSDVTARLLAIARNQNTARETRRSAISWLSRPLDQNERGVAGISATLIAIAKDEDDNQSVRQSALRSLARLEHGAGTTALMEIARDATRSWQAREALSALTSSGDPRARQHLREVVRAASLPDDVLASAIRGLGGEYATGDDIRLLRETHPRLPGDKSRDAAFQAIAQFGGTDNVRWMLAVANDANQPSAVRRRAVSHAYRGGAPVAEIAKIYDATTDTQVKDAVMHALMESGEKGATDKLMQIARMDDNYQMRRKAINVLGRSSDERVKKFLSDLADNR
jgi:transposase-like protein